MTRCVITFVAVTVFAGCSEEQSSPSFVESAVASQSQANPRSPQDLSTTINSASLWCKKLTGNIASRSLSIWLFRSTPFLQFPDLWAASAHSSDSSTTAGAVLPKCVLRQSSKWAAYRLR